MNTYLVGGKLEEWTGKTADILTPICYQGHPEGIKIGTIPMMDEKTVLTTLDAADKAYASGRGEWPTMKVIEESIYAYQ